MPFDYRPIVFGSSGGFGSAAREWWSGMVALDAELNCPVGGISPILAPDYYTWTAQRFSSYWLQRISFALALVYATHVDKVMTQCDGYGLDHG